MKLKKCLLRSKIPFSCFVHFPGRVHTGGCTTCAYAQIPCILLFPHIKREDDICPVRRFDAAGLWPFPTWCPLHGSHHAPCHIWPDAPILKHAQPSADASSCICSRPPSAVSYSWSYQPLVLIFWFSQHIFWGKNLGSATNNKLHATLRLDYSSQT